MDTYQLLADEVLDDLLRSRDYRNKVSSRINHLTDLWLTYTGPNNPKKYNGQDDYTYAPKYSEDIPAFIRDKNFDRLKIRRAGPVFQENQLIHNLMFAVLLIQNCKIRTKLKNM